jgi:hypothetical protein
MSATVTQARYHCKHGCGYESDHRGRMNLHERNHCPKINAAVSTPTDQPKKKKHVCDFRLLNLRDQQEKQAVFAGYKEVCEGCQKLRK